MVGNRDAENNSPDNIESPLKPGEDPKSIGFEIGLRGWKCSLHRGHPIEKNRPGRNSQVYDLRLGG
jgi:hypothetical protein